jgi:hypothetical protein
VVGSVLSPKKRQGHSDPLNVGYDAPVLDKKGEVHYLIQRLGEMKEGQELMLEYKRAGMKGYIQVTPIDPAEEFEIDEDEPTIDADEG